MRLFDNSVMTAFNHYCFLKLRYIYLPASYKRQDTREKVMFKFAGAKEFRDTSNILKYQFLTWPNKSAFFYKQNFCKKMSFKNPKTLTKC